MPKYRYFVGDRVCSGDFYGTVKYLGPVEGTKGDYYGVDWDDESRGKHNGTHMGVTYFTTRDGTNTASFVRPKLLNDGLSCKEAVKKKYGMIDEEDGFDEENSFLPQSGSRKINIEVVGIKQLTELQCQFHLLEVIDLTNCNVYGEENSLQLGHFIPQCQELILSRNILSSWSSVADITRCLLKLHTLQLCGNRLKFNAGDETNLQDAFLRLKTLNLSNCFLSWNEVFECSKLWLHLKELYLGQNLILNITTVPDWRNLKYLDLTKNSLQRWSNVSQLAKLPKLAELLLNCCSLNDIHINEGDFPSLVKLSISENNIKQWTDINELNKLSSLRELTLLSNPVLELLDVQTNRQLIIAKILNLTKHNKTDIEVFERKGAEIDYLKRYGAEWIKCGASVQETSLNNAFYQEHPTFQSLIRKWGPPDKSEVKPEKTTSALRESLIDVNIVDMTKSKGFAVKKKVPSTITIQRLKVVATRLHYLKLPAVYITYRSAKNGQEYEFDHDMRELSYYSVAEGDDILIRPL